MVRDMRPDLPAGEIVSLRNQSRLVADLREAKFELELQLDRWIGFRIG